MSGQAMEWAIKNFPFLRAASEKVVLVKLAHRVRKDDNTGLVWAGVDCTAGDTGTSRQSVLRAQKNLEALGLIKVERRANKTSYIFLQLNFWLEVGATVAPKTVLETKPRVTKSHSRGANVAPLEVPTWHPNQKLNQTLNQKKQQADVVVFEKLIWEKPLAQSEKIACEILLAAAELPSEICQKFADEMGGQGRREPIRNPAGWLKNMIERYRRPGFSFAYSDQVAAARAGRLAQAERESLALPPPPKSDLQPASAAKTLSAVGRAALESMGRHPKTSPPLVKHQPTSSPGATSAHTVATSTPAAATP